jgi:hypothetical protein
MVDLISQQSAIKKHRQPIKTVEEFSLATVRRHAAASISRSRSRSSTAEDRSNE